MSETAAPPRDGIRPEAGVATSSAHRTRIIPGVQGLRAIAVLLVVAFHAGLPIGSGYVGVDVFFVISGFVITRMIFNATADGDKISFKAFWAGRVRRLLPASTAMLVLVLLLTVPLMSPVVGQPTIAHTAIAAVFWLSNAVLMVTTFGYFAPTAESNPLLHTWSLAVEEQFYVVFPVLVALAFAHARRCRTSRVRSTAWVLGTVTVLSLALCVFLTYATLPIPMGPAVAFYAPFSRAWEFGVGALIALAAYIGKVRGGRHAEAVGLLGLVVLVVALVALDNPTIFPGAVATVPVAAAGLLIWSTVAGGRLSGLLSARPMLYIGDRSYGWYLFHWPLIVFVRRFFEPGHTPLWAEVLAAGLGFLLAMASFTYLEQPIRRRQRLGSVRTLRLAAGLMVFPLVLAALTYIGAARGWGDPEIVKMKADLNHGAWKYQAECQSPKLVGDRDMSGCTVSGPDAKGQGIILLGDSNAGVYADALVEVARALRRPVTMATVPSCPLTDVISENRPNRPFLDCLAFYESTMTWLEEQEPSLLVVASGGGTVDNDAFTLRDPSGKVADTHDEKVAMSAAGMARAYQRAQAMGHRIVQVKIVPHFAIDNFRAWAPANCNTVDLLRDVESCGESVSRAEADRLQTGALAAMTEAAATTGVREIDLRDDLCLEDLCSTNRGNFWVYENGAHLSYPGSMTLVPALTAALRTEFARG